MKFKRFIGITIASATVISSVAVTGLTKTKWPDMGPANAAEEDYLGMHRSVRDTNIRPDDVLTLDSDNDLLKRAFNKSVEYSYDELVVGPRQFPLDERDERITKHYEGSGNYTSTAIPAIWGTYHGKPGESYRECFCERDISHTAEAGSLLSLNEENYQMLSRFAAESADLYWRETSHMDEDSGKWNTKSARQMWWPLWSMDFYGDAYYMDAGFQELPAPFEVMDKIWTQYRWTGDNRWIDDTMLNYGIQLHSYDKFMKYADLDGDGLADNGTNKDILPTLYEFEDSGYLQTGDVEWSKLDEETGDSAFPYESELVIKPDFFEKHSFYELPLTVKLVGKNGGNDVELGENAYIVRLKNKEYNKENPAVLKTFEQMNTGNNYSGFHDIDIPVYVPEGVTFEVYNGINKLSDEDYTISDNGNGQYTVTVKNEYFRNTYEGIYRTSAGIVIRFSDGTQGTVIVKMDDSTVRDDLNVTAVLKNGEDVTASLEKDERIKTTYLDYEASELENTNYTLRIRHKDPITPKKEQAYSLKEYCRIASELTRVTTAGDTVGAQYQALLAVANMIRARIAEGDTEFQPFHLEKGVKVNEGEPIELTEDMAQEYEKRAEDIREVIETKWRDENYPQIYARAINKLGEKDMGWGHENSFFMPMKELLNPGEDTINYLNFIQKNALLEEALNEEAITYLPESFYMHGQNVAGWQWTKVGLNRLDPAQKDEQTIVKTYPEIALLNIFNVVGLTMGVEPYAANNTVTTLPRLTSEVGWIEVDNIPLGQSGREALNQDGYDSDGKPRPTAYSKPKVKNTFDLKHEGTCLSMLTNNGEDIITWNAEFYGTYDQLYLTVDGETTEITENIKHKDTAPASTYYTVKVKPGETVTVSTQKNPNGSKPNTEGKIYLSDQNAAFESSPEGKSVQKDQTINGTALYDYTYTKHFDKGLGVQPDTTVRYMIPEGASAFKATPTITDFVRGQDPSDSKAVFEFRIYLDGILKKSVILDRSMLTGEQLNIPINGEKTLDLVVIRAGSENVQESAAWLGAQIDVNGVDEFPSSLPDEALYLTDLEPDSQSGTLVADRGADGGQIIIDHHAFARGLGVKGETSVTYSLGGLYEKLDVVIGAQNGFNTTGTLKVFLNDSQVPVLEDSLNGNNEKPVSIDLISEGKPADTITLVTQSQDNMNLADPILTVSEDADLTDPAIIAKKITHANDIGHGQEKYELPKIPTSDPDNYIIEIASTSEPHILAQDGTINLDDSEHNIQISFRVTEKEGQKRSAETRMLTVYAPAKDKMSLSRIDWTSTNAQNGLVINDKNIDGKKLKLDDNEYEKGLGMPAAGISEVYYDLEDGLYKRFTAAVGADQNSGNNDNSFFRVWIYALDANGDKLELYASPVFTKGPVEENTHKNCAVCKPIIDQYGLQTSDVIDVDIPSGSKTLLIHTERIGDSFWGSCAIGDPYLYLESPYEGKNVESFEEVNVITVQGMKPELPTMIKAKYEGIDTLRLVRVTWDEIDESKYQTPGKFTVEGTVEGTEKKPVCTVEVKDKIITGAENASVVTTIGKEPVLPETVKVVYNDYSSGEEKVIWDAIDENDWAKEGSFTVNGIVAGTSIKVICRVRVDDPNKVLLANVTPDSETALEKVQRDTYEIAGVSYENSIFAHADSELIYTLGGKYTRFTTTVGIKGQRQNKTPNVIFRGFGIDKDGKETLLYDTNMVTRVGDPSGAPGTSDANGYYYVDGDISYQVDVDVTGFEKLKLVADCVENPNTDHAAYGSPILYTAGGEFGKDFHTVTVECGNGGAIWPNGRVAVTAGEDKEFTITPNPENPYVDSVKEMAVAQFKVNGQDTELQDGRFVLENVQEDHSINVEFRESSAEPAAKYHVTVENGLSGEGDWMVGSTVTIKAEAAPEGKVFDKWISEDGVEFADASAAETTFIMPEKDVTVTATYRDKPAEPVEYYTATVENGSGSGQYTAGAEVKIKAEAAPEGKVFDKWISEDGIEFADASAAETTFIMPEKDVTVTATYRDKPAEPVEYYTATVENGSGSGQYIAGAEVKIKAEAAPEGKVFDKWISEDGVEFADASAAETTFIMPENDVLVVATYKNIPPGTEDVDKSVLENLYNKWKEMENDRYTDDSWAKFQNALFEAEAILNDSDALQEDVDAAVKMLNDAKAGLVLCDQDGIDTDADNNNDSNSGTADNNSNGNVGTADDKNDGAGSDNSSNADNTASDGSSVKSPKTGDTSPIVPAAVLVLLSGGAAVLTITKRRRHS